MTKGTLSLLFAGALVAQASIPANALTNEEIFNYRGADRQKVLEEGARKEGTVILYSAMIVNQALRPISEAFRKKYPYIDMKFWRGDDNQIIAKLVAEAQANNFAADVVEGSGASGALGGAKIPAPFYSAYSDIMPPEAVAKDRTWITTRYRYIATGYNTKLVKADEVPKTYDDLLDPKWKGKLAWAFNSNASGAMIVITSLRAAWGEQKAEEYLAKLAKQDVKPLALSNRAVADRMIEGEFLIGLGISAHHPIISAKKGAPADTVMFEPIPALNDSIQVIGKSKHPYAAMLLIDFMLSPEAQTLLQEAEYFPSNPNVQPADSLRKVVPKNNGLKPVVISSEMIHDDSAKSAALFEKLFKK